MKKARITEAQIVGVLKEVEGGRKIREVCRGHGITEARRITQPEEENRRLKKLFADLTLDNQALVTADHPPELHLQSSPRPASGDCAAGG